ncbi:hypothetical protein ACN47E_009811 [Coniothyrium glycines]
MSWNSHMTTSAPFRQQSYGNVQPAYGQQPPGLYGTQPQHLGFSQDQSGHAWPLAAPRPRPMDHRLSKKKGNPIITRYPPPPGYRGPIQPQGSFGTDQSHPAHPSYQAPSGPQKYSHSGYTGPPSASLCPAPSHAPSQLTTHSHQSYPLAQSHSWPQNGCQTQQQYPQAYQYGNMSMQAQHTPHVATQQNFGQSPGWSQQHAQAPPYQRKDPFSNSQTPIRYPADFNVTPTQATAHLVTCHMNSSRSRPTSAIGDVESNENPQLFHAWDDWDFDFDGPIWPKSNEPVDPALSLGVIIWHPAKQMTRALPSTFAEAEEQALKPVPEGFENGDSVSTYFTADNSHEAFLDVRQTDDWELVRGDPIFVEFNDEEMEQNMVPIEDCIAQRDRPDGDGSHTKQAEDQEMYDVTPDIMDYLEQALSGTNAPELQALNCKPETQMEPALTQEDILAKLGVTGAPKPPTGECFDQVMNDSIRASMVAENAGATSSVKSSTLPAVLPRAQSHVEIQTSPTSLYARTHKPALTTTHIRTPAQPHLPLLENQQHGPWNAPHHSSHSFGRSRSSPAISDGSNHTMAGSDFDSENPSVPHEAASNDIPPLHRSESCISRKRSYEDADHVEGKVHQQDDHSKRKRRSHVDAVYSRR